MSEMVERISRALCLIDVVDPDGGTEEIRNWETRQPAARAILMTMREPTDRMIAVGAMSITYIVERDYEYHPAKTAWMEMIDEAIK